MIWKNNLTDYYPNSDKIKKIVALLTWSITCVTRDTTTITTVESLNLEQNNTLEIEMNNFYSSFHNRYFNIQKKTKKQKNNQQLKLKTGNEHRMLP